MLSNSIIIGRLNHHGENLESGSYGPCSYMKIVSIFLFGQWEGKLLLFLKKEKKIAQKNNLTA